MSHTNRTENYRLPQFLPNDKPAWLTDVNTAMSIIDTTMKDNNGLATTANTNAQTAYTLANTANTNAGTAGTKADEAKVSAQTALNAIGDSSTGLTRQVIDLETVVGDTNSGLVKDVQDLKTTVGNSTIGLVKDVNDAKDDIDALKTTVGTSSTGLVHDVNTLDTRVDTLETSVGDSNSGLTKAVDDLDTRVDALEHGGQGFNVLLCYPVGSYYETSDANFNPNTAWGGTWVEDTAGRVLVAMDGTGDLFSPLGKTGGSTAYSHNHTTADHTLTVGELPNHIHYSSSVEPLNRHIVEITTGEGIHSGASGVSTSNLPSGNAHLVFTDATAVLHAGDAYVGSMLDTGGHPVSGGSHNHGDTGNAETSTLQPYTVIKRWHRTA